MSDESHLDRRQLLSRGAALVTSLLVGSASWALKPQRRPGLQTVVAQQLASFLRHRKSARELGRAYLHAHAREADVRLLVEAILRRHIGPGPLRETSPEVLARLIGGQIRRDFEHGRVVSVDGWMLSRTESRLCALAELV